MFLCFFIVRCFRIKFLCIHQIFATVYKLANRNTKSNIILSVTFYFLYINISNYRRFTLAVRCWLKILKKTLETRFS